MNRTEAPFQVLRAERRQFPPETTSVKAIDPGGACIHQLIEQRASETPAAIAVICRDQRLTYSELNARANQVAAWLRKLGVGADQLVGISAERSLEMVICLLGILKSGAAYLPLDPAYPAERLAFMMQDARAAALLYQRQLLPASALGQTQSVSLETCLRLVEGESADNANRGVKPEDLAYVIYTSGSTGTPKGVMIEHRNVTSFFAAMNARLPHDTRCTWLAVTSPSFDISVLELFWPLSRGFKVVLYAGDEKKSSRTAADYSIPALIERYGVTHLQCTPSMASILLLDGRTRDALGRLSALLIGGEAFPVTLAQQLRKIVKGTILNMYGPTETTVWSTTHQVPFDEFSSRIPIGRPIAKTEVYIADEQMNLAAPGAAGELLIGGPGVARGYLGRHEITAQRFIANPFSSESAPRLYRTGDLARFLPDGNIELLGRMDQQVKIRGHRVELGEIESVLNQHPSVRESVVLLREMANGDKALAAYLIPREEQKPARQLLRQYLEARLPDYMVPSHFTFMTAFPQTPNRKVDRNAFPPPAADMGAGQQEPQQPFTETETAFAAIWKEVLSVPRVGRDDNFFEAGGHSMLAMQLIMRVRKSFHIDLTLRSVFDRQTFGGLTESIEALLWANSAKTRPTGKREVVDV